ncbi:MAG: hypothetical protein RMJ06_00135 [Nitrososphaerota archaeon]|nr:hypothetical protein [Nitrososphaerota archaeon]
MSKLLRRYWRVRVPSKVRRGVKDAVIDVAGGRYLVELDRHGRVYVPAQLRTFLDKAKTIVIVRDGDLLVLKPRAY